MDEIERLNGVYRIGIATGVLVVLVALFLSAQPVLSQTNETVTTASVYVNEFISVTLGSVPIAFGSLNPGVIDSAATTNPTTITIEPVTNVNTNISLNGSDFTDGGVNSFGVGNLSFANDTTSTKTDMSTSFSTGLPYSNWVDNPAPGGGPAYIANATFYIDIPSGQISATYNANVTIRVETA